MTATEQTDQPMTPEAASARFHCERYRATMSGTSCVGFYLRGEGGDLARSQCKGCQLGHARAVALGRLVATCSVRVMSGGVACGQPCAKGQSACQRHVRSQRAQFAPTRAPFIHGPERPAVRVTPTQLRREREAAACNGDCPRCGEPKTRLRSTRPATWEFCRDCVYNVEAALKGAGVAVTNAVLVERLRQPRWKPIAPRTQGIGETRTCSCGAVYKVKPRRLPECAEFCVGCVERTAELLRIRGAERDGAAVLAECRRAEVRRTPKS